MTISNPILIPPYGGSLVNLLVSEEEHAELLERAKNLPSLRLASCSLCDLELLAVGAFSPLDRFMGEKDYTRVLQEMRLTNGLLFPLPVALSVKENDISPGDEVALRTPKNEIVAIMQVEEKFERDLLREAALIYGTTDPRHPAVAEMLTWGRFCLSGPLRVLNTPRHYNFTEFYRSPAEVRDWLKSRGYSRAVAFQTRSLIYQTEEEILMKKTNEIGGALVLQGVADPTRPGEIDIFTRLRTYRLLAEKYCDRKRTILNFLPLATRLAGLREILWSAIIQRNYGCDHLFLTDPAYIDGINTDSERSLAAVQTDELLTEHSNEIGVKVLLHRRPPRGTMRPEVAAIITDAYPPRHRQGLCLWFTGLPCAGKSTIAEIVTLMLQEHGRKVTLLDGDVVRTHLSKGLGFTKEDRDTNVLRIGFVASEIVRHNGIAVCAAVSPYCAARSQVRNMVGNDRFVEIFVNTPLDVCEKRDTKGLYARARTGKIRGLTGIDDPYEVPAAPEIILTTTDCSPEENARKVILYLIEKGFLPQKPDKQTAEAAAVYYPAITIRN
ncbi:MAG TPA: adenylyl-sulfate kinase [Desulfotomaculum sp.]|nr:adenylyl-sulfate kinase [Desulfotomaculum sp.]